MPITTCWIAGEIGIKPYSFRRYRLAVERGGMNGSLKGTDPQDPTAFKESYIPSLLVRFLYLFIFTNE